MKAAIAYAVFALSLAGCRAPPNISDATEIPDAPHVGQVAPLSKFIDQEANSAPVASADLSPRAADLVVMADIQINHNLGAPTFWGSSFTQEHLEAVAQRSAQQTALGDLLLQSVVRHVSKQDSGAPIIFLGDAMNMSCGSELSRFFNAMNSTSSMWVAVPGNHDGYYSGITEPSRKLDNKIHNILNSDYGRDLLVWEAVCRRPISSAAVKGVVSTNTRDVIVPKSGHGAVRGFIEQYVADLEHRFPGGQEQAIGDGCERILWSTGTLREIVWCGSTGRQNRRPSYKSFIVQRLVVVPSRDTAPVNLVLMDTSVFAVEPCVWSFDHHCRDAGTTGGIGPEQRQVIDQWVAELGGRIVFAGHHPLSVWSEESDRKWFVSFVESGTAVTYLSAHTHFGCIRQPLVRYPNFREINVGSLIDDPIGYERIWVTKHHSLQLTANYQQIGPEYFTAPSNAVCQLVEKGSDSIAAQTTESSDGPYASQLVRIAAELSLSSRTIKLLSQYELPAQREWIDILGNQEKRVLSAEEVASANCRRSICADHGVPQFSAQCKLDCERNTRVMALPDKPTIQVVAEQAKSELYRLNSSQWWQDLVRQPENVESLACLVSKAPKPYWANIAKPKVRDSECIPE